MTSFFFQIAGGKCPPSPPAGVHDYQLKHLQFEYIHRGMGARRKISKGAKPTTHKSTIFRRSEGANYFFAFLYLDEIYGCELRMRERIVMVCRKIAAYDVIFCQILKALQVISPFRARVQKRYLHITPIYMGGKAYTHHPAEVVKTKRICYFINQNNLTITTNCFAC